MKTSTAVCLVALAVSAVFACAAAQHPPFQYGSETNLRSPLACPSNPCSCCPKGPNGKPGCPCLCGGGWCVRCCQLEDQQPTPETSPMHCNGLKAQQDCRAQCEEESVKTLSTSYACKQGCMLRCPSDTYCQPVEQCEAECKADKSYNTDAEVQACIKGCHTRCD